VLKNTHNVAQKHAQQLSRKKYITQRVRSCDFPSVCVNKKCAMRDETGICACVCLSAEDVHVRVCFSTYVSMCMHVSHTNTHAHTHTHTHTHKHTHTHTHTHKHTHKHTHTHTAGSMELEERCMYLTSENEVLTDENAQLRSALSTSHVRNFRCFHVCMFLSSYVCMHTCMNPCEH
jgi:hypothetical protein